ncbi:MAG: hypothetical protein RLY31_2110 [Bacteroidota bacterium]|jgi:GNAT superfamily N-acetyltransferase
MSGDAYRWTIRQTEQQDTEQLEALQRKVFPNLAPESIITARHYLHHLEIFPEGQFVAIVAGRVVGMTTTMRYAFDPTPHTFQEVSGQLWLTNHRPDGDWLYGLDLGVDPDFRRQGIARGLYRARQETARRLGLSGQLTVGMLNGYHAYRQALSLEDYYAAVRAGTIRDPTVSVQRRLGFEIHGLMPGYLSDPTCGDSGVLMTLDIRHTL